MNENAEEGDPDMTLSKQLMYIYIKDDHGMVHSTFAWVGKGRFW